MSEGEIDSIFRYPIKGLRADNLPQIELVAGKGLSMDRRYAITHGKSVFDFTNCEWVPRRNFLVVAHSPQLVRLSVSINEIDNTVTLSFDGRELATLTLDEAESEEELNEALKDITGETQPGPYKLVSSRDQSNLTDSPTQTISLMNCESLRDLEQSMGMQLSKQRFRGNIWFEGIQAWEESHWINKVLQIGSARVKITEPIVRCPAIDANPQTGDRDSQLLKSLHRYREDACFGVLAEVISAGNVSIGAPLDMHS